MSRLTEFQASGYPTIIGLRKKQLIVELARNSYVVEYFDSVLERFNYLSEYFDRFVSTSMNFVAESGYLKFLKMPE